MRQGQQGRRGRGRGRKVQNPLSRNYESNGPDVKIRGTATHIAEKYGALARDAQASGDVITAENYFQHAEHYNRIIAAAQAQTTPAGAPQPGEGANGAGGQRPRRGGDATGQPAVAAAPEREDTAVAPTEDSGEEAASAASRKKSGNGADTSEEPAAGANGSGQSSDADPAKSSDDAPPDNAVA
ncbi:MAG: DUF4167 domain-containing protein [Methyloligellaceae bacterium]